MFKESVSFRLLPLGLRQHQKVWHILSVQNGIIHFPTDQTQIFSAVSLLMRMGYFGVVPVKLQMLVSTSITLPFRMICNGKILRVISIRSCKEMERPLTIIITYLLERLVLYGYRHGEKESLKLLVIQLYGSTIIIPRQVFPVQQAKILTTLSAAASHLIVRVKYGLLIEIKQMARVSFDLTMIQREHHLIIKSILPTGGFMVL